MKVQEIIENIKQKEIETIGRMIAYIFMFISFILFNVAFLYVESTPRLIGFATFYSTCGGLLLALTHLD